MKTIPLRARNGTVRAHAIVDDSDYAWLNQWRWSLDGDGYACRSERTGDRSTFVRMNRQILGLTRGDGLIGDHISRDRLDNRRRNLRIVDVAASAQNRGPRRRSLSGYRGVNLVKPTGRYMARVRLGNPGTLHNLGTYDTAEEAARVAAAFRVQHMPGAIEAVIR